MKLRENFPSKSRVEANFMKRELITILLGFFIFIFILFYIYSNFNLISSLFRKRKLNSGNHVVSHPKLTALRVSDCVGESCNIFEPDKWSHVKMQKETNADISSN